MRRTFISKFLSSLLLDITFCDLNGVRKYLILVTKLVRTRLELDIVENSGTLRAEYDAILGYTQPHVARRL